MAGKFGPSRHMAAAQLASGIPSQPSTYWAGSRAAQVRMEQEEQLTAAREAASDLRQGGGSGAGGISGGSGGNTATQELNSQLGLLCCSFSRCGSYVVAGVPLLNILLCHIPCNLPTRRYIYFLHTSVMPCFPNLIFSIVFMPRQPICSISAARVMLAR